MLKHALVVTTALALTAGVSAQTATDTTQAPAGAEATQQAAQMTPADFAMQAGASNLFEIESSTAALERELSDEVRAFAEHMIEDHTKAAQDMAPAAEAEGVEIPTELDETHQQRLDSLSGLEGAEFENAYVDAQVMAHEQAVALFSDYASNGPEGALKDFAAATLPTLEEHLAHVQELANAM